ncbi:MAG: O-antigen ligase family protein [Flavobacteriia bacterium]
MELIKNKIPVALSYQLSLGLIALLIALLPKMVVLGFMLMFASIIFGIKNKQVKFHVDSILLSFALLYVAYLIGCIFTNNPDAAGKYLEYKLSFILVPILFSFRPKFKVNLAFPIVGLSIGIMASSLLGILKALSIYSETKIALTSFTSSNICLDHPSYFAAMTTISIAGFWFIHTNRFNGFTRNWVFIYLIFALCMMCLSYAMAGILFLLLVTSWIILRWVYTKINPWFSLTLLLVFPILLFFTVTHVSGFKDEITNSMEALKSYVAHPSKFVEGKNEGLSGDQVRLVMWTVSVKAWSNNPLGVGTGNVDECLSKELKRIGQNELAKLGENREIRYNPHNQFLQIGLEIGILGLIVFLYTMVSAIRRGLFHQNWFLILLVSCLLFNCLFESMLQRQTGIVFFTFWICLLSVHSNLTPEQSE